MCEYFILSKQNNYNIINDDKNQIIYVKDKIYILPSNNISYYISNGLFEKKLIEYCKKFCNKDMNILDIGAHSGTYSISLADYSKNIYAFEPQKMTYYSLCGSVVLSNIRNINCINVGLGSIEQVGKQQLKICSIDGGGSSIHNNSNNNNNILDIEEIEIRTLDSYDIENISFIKIDVEDNELQVLLGAKNTLMKSKYPAILFEMNIENIELIIFLKSFNYNIISINEYDNMFLAINNIL
jgi:FkbM family methyltransferase